MNRNDIEPTLADPAARAHFVGGTFRAPAGDTPLPTTDPSNGRTLATFVEATEGEIDDAVRAARRAYDQVWSRTTVRERHVQMSRLADALERRIERLAWLETLDVGKPIAVSRATMRDLPYTLDYYAGVLLTLSGQTLSVGEHDVLNFTLREPLGVCALIVPWNYPLTLALLKIAPAIAAGNTVVLKPSELTPLSAAELAQAVAETGLPPGVINIVYGGGRTGMQLVEHPLVAKVSFTGGNETGRKIYEAASRAIKRVTLELGGKTPLVVFDDADLDRAVAVARTDNIRNTGQVCAACTRLIVHERIADAFVEALGTSLSSVRIGLPEHEDTEMGPIVSARQLERVRSYEGVAAGEGASVRRYGDVAGRADLAGGYFEAPTLLLDASNDMRVAREEIFGPVQTVLRFSTEEEAVRLANDSPYGLAACAFTRDSGRGLRVAKALQAGTVCINYGAKAVVDAPFGGYKQSGIGKERGVEAMLDDTQIKSVRVYHG
jgi:acyl-CoA reductase-like NAD-dependent aldehyde dehydrogenase